jgi:hypothetical protein
VSGEAAADALYGAPPEEFVARRAALAKELRAAGDREGAEAVKKLRKPSVSAAAVNRLARAASDDVEALLAAGEALRQAQLGGGDREAIRAAARDEREAVETLVGQAGKLSPAVLEEVRETLHAAASDDETRDLIRRGVLTEARRAAGFGGFGMGSASPAPSKKSPPKKKKTREREPDPDTAAAERERAAAERKAEAERKKAAKERVKAAKAALRDAEKAATAAERGRAAAEKALAQAERDAGASAEEVERRRKELEDAEADAA